MAFIKFTETGRSFAPKATISVHGALSFNEGACSRFNIKDHRTAILYYDPENSLIGVELTSNEHEDGARKLRHREMGADISIKPFLDRFNIMPKRTMMYPLLQHPDNGFLIIDLGDGKARGVKRKKSPDTDP